MKASDLCRKHGISDATFYKWKTRYGGLEVSEAKRLKALEDENSHLKRLLARGGFSLNHKKLLRLYHEEGLKVRHRGGRKRALGTRSPMTISQVAGQRWSLDFVSDALSCGRRFRILVVIHDFSHKNLALIADTSLSRGRVARELTALVERYGKSLMIVSDNGTEFTSHAILKWADEMKIEWHYIAPGKP